MKKEQLKEAVGELNCVDTVFEDGGVSYIDTAVSVMQVYDLIDQLDELNKPLVVPKELGEWLACRKLGNEGSFFSIIIELEDMWSECGFEEFITDNKKRLIEVIIGNRGYEIEKEKLYYVIIPTKDPSGEYYYLDGFGGIDSAYDLKEVEHHTESFIRLISENLWQFAKEVTE